MHAGEPLPAARRAASDREGRGAGARRHVVCPVDQLAPGTRKIVEVGRHSVGVFNVDGNYYALRNQCPHKGAPLCEGTIGGTFLPSAPHEYVYGLEASILRCPWHGWEFELGNGQLLFGNDGTRVKTYPVTIEDGMVILHA